MPSYQVDPSSIAQARSSGYSDTEIATFLAERNPVQFKQARDAGYNDTEILAHLSGAGDKPSGALAGFQQGVSSLVHGPAETLKQFAGVDTTAAETQAKKIAPKNYKPASIVPEGASALDVSKYQLGAVPQMVAESAPGMAQDIAVAKLASRAGKLAGLAGGVGSYLLRTRGDTAKENAQFRTDDPNAIPDSSDKTRALVTGAVEAVPQALGISRFLPGASKVSSVGTKGVLESAGKLAATTGIEAGTEGAQELIAQTGRSIGTDKGLTIEPNRLVDAVVTGGATGGALAAPRGARDVIGATRFRDIAPSEQAAASMVAQRILSRVDNERQLQNPSEAFRATDEATQDVVQEFVRARKALRTTLSTEAENALDRVARGGSLNVADAEAVTSSLMDVAGGTNLAGLARQLAVANKLKEKGNFNTARERFSGGMAEAVGNRLRSPPLIGLAGGTGIAAHATGMLPVAMTDPTGLAQTAVALAGGLKALRSVERRLGIASPAAQFVEKFGTGTQETPSEPNVPRAPQASASSLTVPNVSPPPPRATPWGPAEIKGASPQNMLRQQAMVAQGVTSIVGKIQKQHQSSTHQQALPSLRALARRSKALSKAHPADTDPDTAVVYVRRGRVDKASSSSERERGARAASDQAPVEEIATPSEPLFTQVDDRDNDIAAKATEQFMRSRPYSPVLAARYHQSTALRQARIRDRLRQISAADGFPAEDTKLGSALDGLRHTRSREAVGALVDDITATHPEHALLIRAYFGPEWAKSIWNPTRRK